MIDRRTSLRRRVTITGTLVVAVLVLVLDVFVYLSLRDQLLSNLERVLDAREQLVVGLRDELTPEQVAERLDEAGVRAAVRTADGRTIRSAGAPEFETLPPPGEGEAMVGRSVPLGGGADALIMASRAGIDDTLDGLVAIAAVGTAVVIAMAYALFSGLASRVLRPIGDLASTARHIADGSRSERLDARADADELHDMVEAFNGMLDALEDAIARSQAAEELSRRFLADAAHQLRTPAAGIRATIGAVARTDDGEEREQLLDNIARESARLSRSLSSLLRMAQLDRQEPPTFRPVRIAELVDDVVERQRVRSPLLRFDVRLGELPETFVADPDALAEALGNVLDNAARHAASSVGIELTTDGSTLRLGIADDGPGVPAEERERIFERFVSLDGRRGTGLGLPIARRVARSHGGDLVYRSGRFVFSYPLVPDPVPADPPSPAAT